jgi:hypothetical protein
MLQRRAPTRRRRPGGSAPGDIMSVNRSILEACTGKNGRSAVATIYRTQVVIVHHAARVSTQLVFGQIPTAGSVIFRVEGSSTASQNHGMYRKTQFGSLSEGGITQV